MENNDQLKEFTELNDQLPNTGIRICRLCGRTNTHRLESECPGDWISELEE